MAAVLWLALTREDARTLDDALWHAVAIGIAMSEAHRSRPGPKPRRLAWGQHRPEESEIPDRTDGNSRSGRRAADHALGPIRTSGGAP